MPYKDPAKQKARRKKYYYEVEKPKKEEEKIKEEKRKLRKRMDRKRRESEAKSYAWEYKRLNGCSQCEESDPACLVFHHTDPANKKASIHKLYKYGLNTVKKEIKKCILLCANCHMKYHYYEENTRDNISSFVSSPEKSLDK